MKLLQRKQFPGPPPPPPQQAAGLVLLIVQVAPPPPHEMMDQFSHFTRAQNRDNTLIMLLLVNTRTRPASQPPQVQGTGDTGAETQCRDCLAVVMQRDISSSCSVDIVMVATRYGEIVWAGPKDPWVAGWRLLRAAL